LASALGHQPGLGLLASHAGNPVDRLELQTSSRFLLTVNETVSNEILPNFSFRKRADSLRSLMALHQLHTMNPKQAKIKGSLNIVRWSRACCSWHEAQGQKGLCAHNFPAGSQSPFGAQAV